MADFKKLRQPDRLDDPVPSKALDRNNDEARRSKNLHLRESTIKEFEHLVVERYGNRVGGGPALFEEMLDLFKKTHYSRPPS